MDTPASPKATRLATPGWLDTRLVLGVLLVLTSVLLGTRALASADRSQLVWATTVDLAPGSQLTDSDLTRVRVRLFTHAENYLLGSGPAPTGYFLRRGLGAGELLPINALSKPGADLSFRLMTVPVGPGHLPPDLAPGAQVDVYVTPGAKVATTTPLASPVPRLVLADVTVLERRRSSALSATTDDEPVVLRVRPGDVPRVLAAMSEGRIDLVGVPRLQETENTATSS